MRDPEDPNTPSPNAFAEEFLRRFVLEDEPASAAQADVAGPWRIEPASTADGREAFGVWRHGERPEWGDAPAALFRERALALLAAAVRPFVGRDPFYELGKERWNGGFPLLRQGEAMGWVELFDENWAFGVNVLERFTRSPVALARLLQAAGPLALERAGRILSERVAEEGEAQPWE
ncbi:MAG TPA: hypothetical protein VIE43_05325 [Thermoanaerobaculia bacterium]|jgi:hypothetical protein|nr:hypothetical protein [Thermoanaerobaculia bacterium]